MEKTTIKPSLGNTPAATSTPAAETAAKPAAQSNVTSLPPQAAKKAPVNKKKSKASAPASRPAKKAKSVKKPAARKAAPKDSKPASSAAAPKSSASKSQSQGSAFKPAFLNFTTNPTMETVMAQGKASIDKLTQDAASMSLESMDAVMKSSTTFAKGYENILRTTMSLVQSSAEKQTKFIKEALSAKTLNEWTEVQNKMVQANFDDFMSSATKITEMSVKMMSEVSEPLNNQMTKGLKKATQGLAA